MNRPDDQTIVTDEHGNEFACFSKNFGTDIGITVCGNFINDKEFRMEYYYPYLHGSQITTNEMIEIERHAGRESFAGICDELKLGVTLIFYIENIADVLHEKNMCFMAHGDPENCCISRSVTRWKNSAAGYENKQDAGKQRKIFRTEVKSDKAGTGRKQRCHGKPDHE